VKQKKIEMKLILKWWLIATLFPLAAHAQTEVKIMSYNIRLDVKSDGENQWDKRKERVAALMNFYDADFIGAQEVLHHQLQYLDENLKSYHSIGVARDDGKQAGEYSCIFFRKDKYKAIQQSTFWLSPTPDSISKGWDAALNRVCTYGLFEHIKTKNRIWVFNTHFDHIGKQARLESAKLIVEKARQLNTAGLPVIIMGDFNSKPGDEPARYMMDNLYNARDISKIVHGSADTWNGFKFSEKPNGCIDYIFLSHHQKVAVSRFATLTDSYDLKYPSDHFPVLAHIIIDK
jgi:endonuclease/exonuclease/phosphatase family metal-dependent hydrolase